MFCICSVEFGSGLVDLGSGRLRLNDDAANRKQ